jgi:hypothetical protein
MKREADLSDLSEKTRVNITAPTIRLIRQIRFPYYFQLINVQINVVQNTITLQRQYISNSRLDLDWS